MSHKTMGLIAKALHSDGGMPTREELDAALKALNAWKSDKALSEAVDESKPGLDPCKLQEGQVWCSSIPQ